MEFSGTQTAVVTGGGGPNIGRAVSGTLAAAGAQVLVLDVDVDAAESVVDDIEDTGGNASFIECDVTDVEAVQQTIDAVADEFGGIDVLVNNAGGASGVRLDDVDEGTFDDNVDTNLRSAFFTTKAALPHLRRGDGGSVVFVSSINALLGGFSEVAYAVSKAGLHALARCLTADYADDGVRFNVVAPGSVIGDSDTWQRRESEDPGTLDRIADLYPCGRYGRPEDVADAVLFLSSSRSDWVSGVVLPVDGGLTATGALPGGRWWESL
jgi:NAD(P)-dependent dehydrogenase (short-subunit alcohol dehydrogenase family)